jgi:hypothetical protein
LLCVGWAVGFTQIWAVGFTRIWAWLEMVYSSVCCALLGLHFLNGLLLISSLLLPASLFIQTGLSHFEEYKWKESMIEREKYSLSFYKQGTKM